MVSLTDYKKNVTEILFLLNSNTESNNAIVQQTLGKMGILHSVRVK